tara:strand:+ start:124 stop:378 length:255 start_codon:yes stop_codon:yes gene_type:complete
MASRSKRNVKKTMKRKNQVRGGGKRTKKLSKKVKKVKKTLKKGMNWMKCLSKARKELGIKGFVAINKGKDGVALYKRAKEICGK